MTHTHTNTNTHKHKSMHIANKYLTGRNFLRRSFYEEANTRKNLFRLLFAMLKFRY